jgi:hypothetical protein
MDIKPGLPRINDDKAGKRLQGSPRKDAIMPAAANLPQGAAFSATVVRALN